MAESLPEDPAMLAAEHALGVLEGSERAEAMRRMLADPGFAAEVDAWRERFAPLCTAFAEVPPPALWAAIERRIDAPQERLATLERPDRSIRAWQFGAIGSSLVAASLAAVLVFRPAPAPVEVVRAPQQLVMAQLDGGEAGAFLAANYDPREGALRIRAIRMPASPLAPELWIIPADGVPRSLGLVAASGVSDVAIAVPHRKLMQEGATLAITMEAPTSAPHAAPTSAPVAAGKISTI